MGFRGQVTTALKALRELGPRQVGYYALYRLQLRSSYLKWRTKDSSKAGDLAQDAYHLSPLMQFPARDQLVDVLGESGCANLLKQADEIHSGKVRLFAGDPVSLDLGPARSDLHWTDLEQGKGEEAVRDVKPVWEIGRFGWAVILARAYRVSGDERYPQAFWEYLETFVSSNPPYFGYHWTSAQEVALRLVALAFASQLFDESLHSTAERKIWLGRAIAVHAARIPPSMSYAKAQGNNHLLVEAIGLYTAGVFLHNHPQASRWRQLGWHWSNKALQEQIAADGAYVQQSTNYHRLMLQAALWVNTLVNQRGDVLPEATLQRLAAATRWLLALLDLESGRVPNLGPNDGALILPLSVCSFHDYRPVLQAAACAFRGERIFEPGLWDEEALWHAGKGATRRGESEIADGILADGSPGTDQPLVIRGRKSWAYLRAAHFKSRPGHADQLHLDLWWRGLNIAPDAGTYLYNAQPPWDNALSGTPVHNTITVNGKDQMNRAGRFLWLDWAQASNIAYEKAANGSWERGAAEHNGYRRLGVLHRRVVTGFQDDRWLVEDTLSTYGSRKDNRNPVFAARLHWLLPDWTWNLSEQGDRAQLNLESPLGQVSLSVDWCEGQLAGTSACVQLIRGGVLLAGTGVISPINGWYSPTYDRKLPCLSYSVAVDSRLPLKIISEWSFA